MSQDTTPKVKKPFKTTRLEVAKTVAIAVLITAVLAFMAGVRYQNNRDAELDHAVQQAQAAMQETEAAPVKK